MFLGVLLLTACSSKTPVKMQSARLVGYLPDYEGRYADYARTLDLNRITHLILTVDIAPSCTEENGATSLSYTQTNQDIAAIVSAAHRAGALVLVSFYGDSTSLDLQNCYENGKSAALVASIDEFVSSHHLDGVDLDIEDPAHVGSAYDGFVARLAAQMHQQSHLLTAAVAEWIQVGMQQKTLQRFDFLNVMVYSNLQDAQEALDYYSQQQSMAANRLVLGVPFFGTGDDEATEASYSEILSTYPDAWSKDRVSGGALDDGMAFNYVGVSTMAAESTLGAEYGGVMIWELTQDVAGTHSLLQVVRQRLSH